jgi:hypothetical protein
MPLPFQVTTTYGDGRAPTTKPFTWSYSKLKNYRNCPKKHFEVDLAKNFKEEEGEALVVGNQVHKAMELRVSKGTPLPPALAHFEPEAAKVVAHMPAGTILLVEQKAAFTRDFRSCGYFDKDCWYRAKCDVVKVCGPIAAAIDWKTGKIVEDSEQLALMAAWVFSAYPAVQQVATKYVWLGNNAETKHTFTRADMVLLWNHLLPEVNAYEQACATSTFPAKPSGLCRSWCPVTSCAYHGKGNR